MSRFEDTLVRDLNVIADRATPSPDAWDSILTRIETEAPTQETEIIMLTDNTMPTRRWPLVAAAAAVIALIVGTIAYVGTRDGDNIPADPTPTVAPTPDDDALTPEDAATPEDATGPNDAAEPDADSDAEPVAAAETDEAPADASTAAVTEPRSLSLTGELTGTLDLGEPDADGTGSLAGRTYIFGDATGDAYTRGSYTTTDEGLVGTRRLTLDVRIPDTGEGTLYIVETWTARPDGSSEHVGTVEAGSDDFVGAQGTWTVSLDGAESSGASGAYTLELSLPPIEVAGADSFVDDNGVITTGYPSELLSNDFQPIDDGDDTTDTYVYTTTERDSGEFYGNGHELVVGPNSAMGVGQSTTDVTLDGIGTGTMESISLWRSGNAAVENQTFLIGGTGDLAGYTGSGYGLGKSNGTVWRGSNTLVPGPEMARVMASGTWIDEGYSETPRDGSTTVDTSYSTTYEGDAVGTASVVGFRTPHENDGGSDGGATMTFTGEIAGVGSGTLTIEERFAVSGPFFSVGVVTGGTDDFAGARGTIRFDHFTYEIDIEVPATGDIDRPRVVELAAAFESSAHIESDGDDGAIFATGLHEFSGQLIGEGPYVGNAFTDGEFSRTTADAAFSGTIEGVGTGTLTMRELALSDSSGYGVSAVVLTGGTGDFQGAAGWMLLHHSTGTSEIELRLP